MITLHSVLKGTIQERYCAYLRYCIKYDSVCFHAPESRNKSPIPEEVCEIWEQFPTYLKERKFFEKFSF